jgi:hypothetical protein
MSFAQTRQSMRDNARTPLKTCFAVLKKGAFMYKEPKLSSKARLLRRELATLGVEVPHHVAMQMAAKMQGHKNIHVAQAKKNRQGLDARELASKQAAEALFERLGKYENDIAGLLASLKHIFQLGDSRRIEGCIHRLQDEDGLKLSELGALYRWEDLPQAFETLRQRLLATLEKSFQPKNKEEDEPGLAWEVCGWELEQGETELPQHYRRLYCLELSRSDKQLYVNLKPSDSTEGAQLTLTVEVNRGLPCVHLGNDIHGEMLVSVFATKEGLYLRPNGQDCELQAGTPPSGTQMRMLHDEDTRDSGSSQLRRVHLLSSR